MRQYNQGRSIAACVLLVAFTAVPTMAQVEPPDGTRSGGFRAGFGIGAGDARIDCSRCGPREADDPWDGGVGGSGYLMLGGTLRPNLVLGGELNLWVKRDDEQRRDATLALTSVVVQFHPRANLPLYLKTGLGVGASILAGGNGLLESGGWGGQAGVGYEIGVGSRYAIAPFANVVMLRSRGSEGRNRGVPAVGPDNPRWRQIGIGFSRY
jgi:hypothetical protein